MNPLMRFGTAASMLRQHRRYTNARKRWKEHRALYRSLCEQGAQANLIASQLRMQSVMLDEMEQAAHCLAADARALREQNTIVLRQVEGGGA